MVVTGVLMPGLYLELFHEALTLDLTMAVL